MLDYAWLMLIFPALGTLILAFFGRRIGRRLVGWLACGMVLLSFLTAVGVFATMVGLPAEERNHQIVLWSWMTSGAFHVDVALLIDHHHGADRHRHRLPDPRLFHRLHAR
jgi:NADH-quinone oxidoreductase subunit L